jgi:hypothetical protein
MLYVKEFPNRIEMEYFLQDKVLGSEVFDSLATINVRALTLIFTTPVKTITFPDTVPFETATPGEIWTEADSQSAGRLWVIKVPGGSARLVRFALLTEGDVTTGGTAAPILGLPPTPGPVTVGANKIAVADLADIYFISTSAQYGAVYDA